MAERVRIFQHPDSLLVGHVRNLIERAGIPCELRNWMLAGGMGDLAPIDCEPELWVAPHNAERAEAVIAQWRRGDALAEGLPDWQCPVCGEAHEGVFDRCWQCGGSRPERE
ncbi:putative signal transducing protein [Kushneria sinocarnis]|uniref:Putative signal transducing protein n=1 Tax=Kushneria sinocarnis TaxID=595502 RepID=A0A420WXK1_9GAMM|nr:DUF2007 domain-containing protein [Kushneria sinocarnis]RKR04466.1 putative signal transducing protein [Kushneria sinocarnis]